VSQPFTGNIAFNKVKVTAAGMPDSTATTLPAGQPVTVPVTITNNGEQAEDFYADPRLSSSQTATLAPYSQASGLRLPLVVGPPEWFMPTEALSVSASATASLPIEFDYSPFPGTRTWSAVSASRRAGPTLRLPGISRTVSGLPSRARSGHIRTGHPPGR
jgi:hypothetical protein